MNTKFITLGCKVNQAESEALAAYANTDSVSVNGETANICVINTCAVTSKAAMQSRQAIRKAVKTNPGATIIVTGCYAQIHPEAISDIEGVDYIVGQYGKHLIFDIVDSKTAKNADCPVVINESFTENRLFSNMPAQAFGSRTRPFLKIQDGCDSFCSYCIVPFSRGRSRSLPPDLVMSELDSLISSGAMEIVLTGIHLGKWGTDLPGKYDLLHLIERILGNTGLQRLRLSSLEPTEIKDSLLDLIKSSPKICRHFHVPLQSGDPEVLKRMNRHYSPDMFAEIILKIKEHFTDAAIGIDVMAGFPGETEQAFENSLKLIERLPVSYLHVFPFSPRPPAPAARYPDAIASETIKKRAAILTELGKAKKAEFYKSMKGRMLEVVIEKQTGIPEYPYKGLSSNYIPVCIQTNQDISINRIINCMVTDVDEEASVSAIYE